MAKSIHANPNAAEYDLAALQEEERVSVNPAELRGLLTELIGQCYNMLPPTPIPSTIPSTIPSSIPSTIPCSRTGTGGVEEGLKRLREKFGASGDLTDLERSAYLYVHA